MPPEVISGQPYNSKADVWAVGIILYELITFRKPFDCDRIQGVFKKVVEQPYEPLPPNTDTNLQLLIDALLNKDYNKRPNIFDVAKIPCVNKYILKFIEDHNC
jgi:NIMA (never in mitosis gene a)-related kinase